MLYAKHIGPWLKRDHQNPGDSDRIGDGVSTGRFWPCGPFGMPFLVMRDAKHIYRTQDRLQKSYGIHQKEWPECQTRMCLRLSQNSLKRQNPQTILPKQKYA